MFPRSFRKYIGQKPLPFEILTDPVELTDEYIETGYFKEISDKKIIIDQTHKTGGILFFACMFSLGGFFFILPPENISLSEIVFGSIFLMIGGGLFAYLKIRQVKHVIFDRRNQTVTLHPVFWGENETIPFREVYATIHARQLIHPPTIYHGLALMRSDNSLITIGISESTTKDDVNDYWSLFVWYMDKHRPLPPGEVFDKYREKDIEKQKTEKRENGLAYLREAAGVEKTSSFSAED